MQARPSSRFSGAGLAVQVLEMSPYLVTHWRGTATEHARPAALEAVGDVLGRSGEHVLFEFAGLGHVSDGVVEVLARGITEAQRLGRAVTLVRCSEELFRCLQRAGANGAIRHAASLLAATQGLAKEQADNVDLYLRSSPEMLRRLRSVVSAVAREARLSEMAELALRTAVTEAAANAIRHGSPEGVRNHVRVTFHVEPAQLIVEVADQGRGFDPASVPAPVPAELRENGYGLHIMRESMDRVEFFRDEAGMLVRMTKLLGVGR